MTLLPDAVTRPTSRRLGIAALALSLVLSGCLPTFGSDTDAEEATAAPTVVPSRAGGTTDDAGGEDPSTMEDDPDAGEDPSTMEDDPDTGEDPSTMEDTANGEATVLMAGESFTFTLSLCMISDTDILVHGPGTGVEEGIPAYLDIDFHHDGQGLAGEARIERGTDQQFDSTDDFYAANLGDAAPGSTIDVTGNSFVFEGDFHSALASNIGPGTLSVDCDA